MTNKTTLILGANSAIAFAFARNRAKQGGNLILVGRNQEKLKQNEVDLKERGAKEVLTMTADFADIEKVNPVFDKIIKCGKNVDEILIAYGDLTDQDRVKKHTNYLVSQFNINMISVCAYVEKFIDYFVNSKKQINIAVIGSVAGDRGRQSNYVYGAAKGGLEVFIRGMQHRLYKSNVSLSLIKPGFVKTPMTSHMNTEGLIWSTPEVVASYIDKAILAKKPVIYAPFFWRYIMLIIKNIPDFVLFRTSL